MLSEKVAFLSSPAAYGPGFDAVEVRETHMAWVFLTGSFAYKLKKPIRRPHLDFGTIAKRGAVCRAELRLNRRLAAETYLDVVPLRRDRAGTLHLGAGRGRIVDWLVRMRRLPQDAMLDTRIASGRVTRPDIEALGTRLAEFYASRRAERSGGAAYVRHLRREQALNRTILLQPRFGIAAQAGPILDRLDTLFEAAAPLIAARAADGAILEGHGDLRPEHVCLSPPIQIIDCLEFNRTMRVLDPYDEIAYLGIECDMLGAAWIRPQIAAAVTDCGIPPPPPGLAMVYAAFRCVLRARLSILHLRERPIRHPGRWRPLAVRYLHQAWRELLNPPCR